MHPIADKAEIAVEFPDKLYMGQFGSHSSFDAGTEADGVLIRLSQGGPEKREAQIHLHYLLFADIIEEIGRALAKDRTIDVPHRERLQVAARSLAAALDAPPAATEAT